jgi:cytosine/adenosine deaminase-related metal-dependent hydrolase
MLVEGAVLDADGPRPAYVRFRHGRVVEVGRPGTDSTHGRDRKIRGIVIPSPGNGHTHLGDAVSVREPPSGSLARLVGTPGGYKFRLLRDTPRPAKVRAVRAALARMARARVGLTVDFREEGLDGIAVFREAARGSPVRAVVLGRPLARPIDPAELAAVVRAGDGVGLSSARDETEATRRTVARACRAAGKRFGLHASEAVREPPETYLDPRPDLLVHLARATPDDLAAVREAGVTVAVCPRSNALFGRQPDLRAMERLGVATMLGTDNAMFHSPSIWRELEFAYIGSRLRHRPVSAEFLARAALVEPWRWLGTPAAGRIAPGSPARPIVLRLPPDDPAYQVVTRTTEHLMVRVGPDAGPSEGAP